MEVRELIYFQIRNFVQRTLRDFHDTRIDFRKWINVELENFQKSNKATVCHFSFGWFRKGLTDDGLVFFKSYDQLC